MFHRNREQIDIKGAFSNLSENWATTAADSSLNPLPSEKAPESRKLPPKERHELQNYLKSLKQWTQPAAANNGKFSASAKKGGNKSSHRKPTHATKKHHSAASTSSINTEDIDKFISLSSSDDEAFHRPKTKMEKQTTVLEANDSLSSSVDEINVISASELIQSSLHEAQLTSPLRPILRSTNETANRRRDQPEAHSNNASAFTFNAPSSRADVPKEAPTFSSIKRETSKAAESETPSVSTEQVTENEHSGTDQFSYSSDKFEDDSTSEHFEPDYDANSSEKQVATTEKGSEKTSVQNTLLHPLQLGDITLHDSRLIVRPTKELLRMQLKFIESKFHNQQLTYETELQLLDRLIRLDQQR